VMTSRKKRKGGGGMNETSILKMLECPICLETMGPPIYQCREGHLICAKCREKIVKCPTCRVPLDHIRNRALENMVAKMVVPCPNQTLGCTMKVKVEDLMKHEENCLFRMYECPRSRSSCVWTGPLHEVANHLSDKHNMMYSNDDLGVINETYSNPDGVKNAVWEGPMMRFNGNLFLVHFEQMKTGEYVSFIRFFGNEDDAGGFRYKMTVERGGRLLSWTGVPRSIRDSVKDVISSNDCLIIKENMAYFFSDNSSTGHGTEKTLRLPIKGKIWIEAKQRSKAKRTNAGCSKAIQPPVL